MAIKLTPSNLTLMIITLAVAFVPMASTKDKNATALSADPAKPKMEVVASSDYDGDSDRGHKRNYCFKQRLQSSLFFDVTVTDVTADKVYFELWDLREPNHPSIVETVPGKKLDSNHHVQITVSKDRGGNRPHLGQGPYGAVLTASAPGRALFGRRHPAGNYVYAYETWESNYQECRFPK